MNDTIEMLLQELENAASMMRGMQFDHAIPAHARGALMSKALEIEAVVAKVLEENE